MVNDGRSGKKGFHWNHNISNGFVIAVVLFIMSGTIVSCAEPTKAEANNSITINCSELKTCQKCADQASCLWSLERQACFVDYGMPLTLVVRTETDCPRVSVVAKVTYAANLPYVYTVKVVNDVNGFMAFLGQTRVSCIMLDVTSPAVVTDDTISCAPVNKSDLGFDHQTVMTYHCYVMFGDGDTILRLDDGADSYFTVYDEFFYGFRMDESCVACLWDVGQYAYYYKWCSSRNTATGRYMFYVGYSETDHNAVMPANDRASATVPASSGCNDVRIQSVEPLSALWTGGLHVKVTINNHVILADGGGRVKVTVAGRECVRPTMTDRGTGVTCLLTAPGRDDVAPQVDYQGPVLVTYQPSSITVESAQTFRFVYPEITDVSPSCGSLAGGTLLTIRGRHLDAGSHVTVAVALSRGEPSSVTCEVVSLNDDRILCLTGPSNGPATGHVSVVFDKALRLHSGTFTYTAKPVLAAGLKFEGIASGGTAVTVRGTGFACISNATMYVDRQGVRRVASDHCHQVNDTHMTCSTPKLDGPAAGKLPERLHFGFHVQLADGHVSDMPPHPDTDGYVAHADPVLENFFIASPTERSVLVYGLDLGHGYRAADISVVRLSKNLTAVACNVTAVIRGHIVCESDSPAGLNGVSVLVISVGDHFAYTVHRKIDNHQSLSFQKLIFMLAFVSAVLALCYYKLKSMNIARLVAGTV